MQRAMKALAIPFISPHLPQLSCALARPASAVKLAG
jgi:hypothetical protein